MKVLIITLAYHPFVGGAEIAVKEITDRLPNIKFDMVTVNLDGKQQDIQRLGNVTVYRLGKGKLDKYLFPFVGYKKAVSLHQENNYDAVWAIMANQAGIVALKLKQKFPRLKYLLTLQEGDSLKKIWSRTWFMRRGYKKIYQRADKIQVISNYLGSRALKHGYNGSIEIVPNGVDLNLFNQKFDLGLLAELKDQLGITEKDTVIITTSRLVHKNGLNVLISAIRNLPVKLLILGDGPLSSKLKSLAQEMEVSGKVIFLGHIDYKDMVKYLKISDIFVRPSRSEGLGSSFLEAMAAGLPVIGTKVGGIVDFLQDGETGLFCEVDNPADLAKKIQILIDDQSLRDKIVNNGLMLVEGKYQWVNLASRMEIIFKSL